MQDHGLLIDKDHLLQAVDIRCGNKAAGLIDEDVIQFDQGRFL
jgi:hypothetical protein